VFDLFDPSVPEEDPDIPVDIKVPIQDPVVSYTDGNRTPIEQIQNGTCLMNVKKKKLYALVISVIIIAAGALFAILKEPPDPVPITTTTTTSTTSISTSTSTTTTPKTTGQVVETTPTPPQQTSMTTVGPQETQTVEEIIEADVLSRGNKFSELSLQDSRRLALDWLLNEDLMQVTSTDFNLSQRYILALLAFEFWTMFQLSMNWLSNKNECSWDGITCNEGQGVIEIILGTLWVNVQLSFLAGCHASLSNIYVSQRLQQLIRNPSTRDRWTPVSS
jgi:hypothetical protein